MTKNSIMRTIAAVCSVTFLAIVGYAQDKPIKKDLKFTIIPKNINNPYMVIQSGGAMDACKELGIEGKVGDDRELEVFFDRLVLGVSNNCKERYGTNRGDASHYGVFGHREFIEAFRFLDGKIIWSRRRRRALQSLSGAASVAIFPASMRLG